MNELPAATNSVPHLSRPFISWSIFSDVFLRVASTALTSSTKSCKADTEKEEFKQ
jgi:hypothetical protein